MSNLTESVRLGTLLIEADQMSAALITQVKRSQDLQAQLSAQLADMNTNIARYKEVVDHLKAAGNSTIQPTTDALDKVSDTLSDAQDHVEASGHGLSRVLGFVGALLAGWKLQGA